MSNMFMCTSMKEVKVWTKIKLIDFETTLFDYLDKNKLTNCQQILSEKKTYVMYFRNIFQNNKKQSVQIMISEI